MAWVGAIVALAAAAASAYNTKQVARKQDQNAAAGIRRQSALQDQANQRILSTISDAKKSTSDAERQKSNEQYLDTLRKSMGAANQGLASRGLSQQFDQLAGGEAANNADFGENLAGLMARMDAPVQQRRNEAASYGNLGMDLTRLGGDSSGQDFLTRLKASSIRRNPWIDLAASAANGYASNYSGGTGAAGGGGNGTQEALYANGAVTG